MNEIQVLHAQSNSSHSPNESPVTQHNLCNLPNEWNCQTSCGFRKIFI